MATLTAHGSLALRSSSALCEASSHPSSRPFAASAARPVASLSLRSPFLHSRWPAAAAAAAAAGASRVGEHASASRRAASRVRAAADAENPQSADHKRPNETEQSVRVTLSSPQRVPLRAVERVAREAVAAVQLFCADAKRVKLALACAAAAAATALFYIRPPPSLAFTAAPATNFAGAHAATATSSAALAAGHWSEVVRAAWTGLVAGCLHTLTGPDHLAALAPLTIGRSRVQSAVIGALWGCGHDAGQVMFGVLFLLLKDKLHLDLLRVWGSRIVGATLLAIGALGIYEAQHATEEELAAVARGEGEGEAALVASGGSALAAAGAAAAGGSSSVVGPKAHFGIATFVTGVVHGLQPDALLVVLPALAMPSRAAGAAFLVLFLLGTVLAMGSYTAFIGSCSSALKERVPGFTKGLSWVAALMAIALGLAILLGEVLGFQLF
ncbi:hypothetical protein CLOP_g23223 [Closterium sp. NIES-67]|nr:hypothetical protein CLOP_g23223 [Closterium sp. NIES-67]